MRAALILRAVAAAAAGALALVAGLRAHADAAYRRGLGYTDRPAEDVPGRLKAYEEAVRRTPRTFTYLLRSGQIHLARAGTATLPGAVSDRRHELDLAGQRIRAAIAVHPLDARARVALAQYLVLQGAPSEALAVAQRAVDLGPRHPTVQSAAVRVALDVWRRFARIDALALALDLDAFRASWQDEPGVPRDVRRVLRSRAGVALPDLLEACAGDATRLAVAERWAASALPDLAPVIASALQRVRDRP